MSYMEHSTTSVKQYKNMHLFFNLFLLTGFLPIVVTAFQPTLRHVQLPFARVGTPSSSVRQHIMTKMSTEGFEEEDDFVITPNQILIIRKEARKRKLPKVSLTPEESEGPFSHETLSTIAQSLNRHELVQVRGISRENTKNVRDVSESLALDLERVTERIVFSIDVKGFAATLYCPMEDDNPDKIKLFSSYRPNQWKRRPRVVRDNSGRFSRDEDGNIIRERPDI